MPECVFCKLIEGTMPSHKIYETEFTFVILDINPANPGHCLVIPKKHFENIYDADNAYLEDAIITCKIIAARLKEKLGAEGVNIIQNNEKVAGQLVEHLYFHVIPRYKDDKVVIGYNKKEATEADLRDMEEKLSITAAPKQEPTKEAAEETTEQPKEGEIEFVEEVPDEEESEEKLRKWAFEEDY